MIRHVTGYTRFNISKTVIENMPITIPSFEEQKQIIDIIEPIEFVINNLISLVDNLHMLFKNFINIKRDKKNMLQHLVRPLRNKSQQTDEIIDLSKINSDSLLNNSFSKSSGFKTNKFFAKKNNIFISTIRPKLKKYGIVIKDIDILGTLLNFESINEKDIGYILAIFSSDEFQKYCDLKSKGTKMPIIS
ncbi:MAG: restriction endonuclease subunit S [Lactobacillaceae bacterium]|jgi:restriction endonuclease S subunit|nr:restriction endonuclease subunit S [Lactobacillaceae bacterium]